MPLYAPTPMDLKLEFCRLASAPSANLSELCRRYAISRVTAYRYLERYRSQGPDALAERSRRPNTCPFQTPAGMQAYLLELKDRYPFWGAAKLLAIAAREQRQGLHAWPLCSRSAAERILRQAGKVSQARQVAAALPERFERQQPNQLWQMDFKGHVPLTQGGRCHPLVIIDDHSRFCLSLTALASEAMLPVQKALTCCLERNGMPEAILCDNGGVWASSHGPALAARQKLLGQPEPGTWIRYRSLSALEAWLIALGIEVIHGAPYHPQTQGKCERFNQTLKYELLEGRLRQSLQHYQNAFDQFRHCYNQIRPHQALNMQTPQSRYRPSHRSMPARLAQPCYPAHYQTYRVAANGCFYHNRKRVFIGEGLRGAVLGLEPKDGQSRNQRIFYYKTELAMLCHQP